MDFFFRRGPFRRHDANVIYGCFKEEPDIVPYYSVVCRCGWFVEPVEAPVYPDAEIEARMQAALQEHQPGASTEVLFPVDVP